MILTNCAACAAPLAHTAPRCVRCRTRYCDSTCQHDHWRRGHKQICKKIHRGGNAEQYHADKKYKEAVAVAVEACAADTKGQTCYICTQALHWKTKEGLVRGCACRGTSGFVHVSCLAEQAKILCDEACANNLEHKAFNARWQRWQGCSMCKQEYHGVVRCALGWACWKTYVGRPDTLLGETLSEKLADLSAMEQLVLGLGGVGSHETINVCKAQVEALRQRNQPEHVVLSALANLASAHENAGNLQASLDLQREVNTKMKSSRRMPMHLKVINAYNFGSSLLEKGHIGEGRHIAQEWVSIAQHSLGPNSEHTLRLRSLLAECIFANYEDETSSDEDLFQAEAMQRETVQIAQRYLGAEHPLTHQFSHELGRMLAFLEVVKAGSILTNWIRRRRQQRRA